jgi:hypothetical protein
MPAGTVGYLTVKRTGATEISCFLETLVSLLRWLMKRQKINQAIWAVGIESI